MTNKLNAQSLGFQPLRTGDRKGQSGDICSRSNQQKASVTFEVVRELGFGLIVDCQVFFKGASKNVRTSDSPVVPRKKPRKAGCCCAPSQTERLLFPVRM